MKVSELADFGTMQDNWNIMLDNGLFEKNIFMTWEWQSIWWKHYGENRKLLFLQVEHNDRVLALAPLMLTKYKLPLVGNVKKVEFVGAPKADYHDFIVIEKHEDCLKSILNYLDRFDWDWIELGEVLENSLTGRYLRKEGPLLSPHLLLSKRLCNICPYTPLPKSINLLNKMLPKNLRKNLTRRLRNIKTNHDMQLMRYDEANFSVEKAVQIFVQLHQKRWNAVGLPGAFKEDDFRLFLLDVAKCFAERGWLGLYFLMADDKPVSARYTFEYQNKIFCYLTGFDPDYSRYSVGSLITMLLLEASVRKGVAECDFLRGDEAYKTHWASKYRKNLEFKLVRRKAMSRLNNWIVSNSLTSLLASKLGVSLKKQSASH